MQSVQGLQTEESWLSLQQGRHIFRLQSSHQTVSSMRTWAVSPGAKRLGGVKLFTDPAVVPRLKMRRAICLHGVHGKTLHFYLETRE